MSESEPKSSQEQSVVSMIDDPEPFASRAEWEQHLAELRSAIVEYGPHPQLDAAIAQAEAAI